MRCRSGLEKVAQIRHRHSRVDPSPDDEMAAPESADAGLHVANRRPSLRALLEVADVRAPAARFAAGAAGRRAWRSRATLLQRDLVAETGVVVRAVDLEHEANVPHFDRQPDLSSIQVEIARATHAPLAAYTAVAALRFRP